MYLLWRCIGCYIKVFWANAERKITYGPANDVGLIACLLQGMGYFDCIFGKELWVNPMGFFCNALWRASTRRNYWLSRLTATPRPSSTPVCKRQLPGNRN